VLKQSYTRHLLQPATCKSDEYPIIPYTGIPGLVAMSGMYAALHGSRGIMRSKTTQEAKIRKGKPAADTSSKGLSKLNFIYKGCL
jgi:hypothetical protein